MRNFNQKGFSLVETIIVMLVFLIVVGSIYGLLQVGFIDRNRANREVEVAKNARIAIHLIGRDALNAGLSYTRVGAVAPNNFLNARLGIPPDLSGRDIITAVIPGNNVFTNNLDPSVRTDLVAFAFADVEFNGGSPVSITNAVTSGSNIILSYDPNTLAAGFGFSPFDLLLIQSDSNQVAVMVSSVDQGNNRITLAPGDPLGINLPANGTGNNANILRKCASSSDTNCTNYPGVTAKRFFWVAYRVEPDGTLVKINFGNNRGQPPTAQIQRMPIAYNVKDMQITYLLSDGRVLDNPAAGPNGVYGDGDDTPLDMNMVIQVNVTLTVQSPEIDEQLRRRREFTVNASFSTRNVNYDA
ncbi:MAG: prepilin-type N-terminal cleavage/methylation domain-containing protein [Acidobacteria bacterium]|jgi:prepilin-type N-terminal cleavage/methylation domain-containing protein|nr:MAG: prepilin-type N-terminal cleavage/methylation domain-containing protein [Acidobacteriota bacterium]GIU81687.1 MAG: type IV pilus minor pilin PilW [Pyrinomonadaceae bacterium]